MVFRDEEIFPIPTGEGVLYGGGGGGNLLGAVVLSDDLRSDVAQGIGVVFALPAEVGHVEDADAVVPGVLGAAETPVGGVVAADGDHLAAADDVAVMGGTARRGAFRGFEPAEGWEGKNVDVEQAGVGGGAVVAVSSIAAVNKAEAGE